MTSPERLGVFGGAFDPPHNGHLQLAIAVQRALQLDTVLFVPNNAPPHKSRAQASYAMRCQWLRKLVAAYSWAQLSLLEQDPDQLHYTAQTLTVVRQQHATAALFLLMGADSFNALDSWYAAERLLSLTNIVVVERPGEVLRQPQCLAAKPFTNVSTTNISVPLQGAVFSLTGAQLDISSTEIKQRLTQQKSIAGLVPDAIRKQIKQGNTYVQ